MRALSKPRFPNFSTSPFGVDRLDAKVCGDALNRVRIASPFRLRTAVPPIASVEGRQVVGIAGRDAFQVTRPIRSWPSMGATLNRA